MSTEIYMASETSGEITSDGQVFSGPGRLCSILIITDGTNDATVTLYDNTSAAGTKLWEGIVKGADNYGGRNWTYPVKFTNGVYADLSGTGASCICEKALP